jgi:hypothetical protein
MQGTPNLQVATHGSPGYQRRWWALAVLCLSLVLLAMDNTILNVALPTLASDLEATGSQLQWMVDAYLLVFAGLLLTMGALGDRFGRKLALDAGLLVFAAGSAASAFAGSPEVLIAARAAMGIGAALIMPATLSIITNIFLVRLGRVGSSSSCDPCTRTARRRRLPNASHAPGIAPIHERPPVPPAVRRVQSHRGRIRIERSDGDRRTSHHQPTQESQACPTSSTACWRRWPHSTPSCCTCCTCSPAPSWPERKRRAPCAASSLATALPTSPLAPTMTAVLSSRRRGLVAAVIDDMGPPFLGSLTSEAADTGQGVGARSRLGMA